MTLNQTKTRSSRSGLGVLEEQCETCIFRPGNLMKLRAGRVKQMVTACMRQDTHIPCHETLTYTEGEDAKLDSPVCRGFYDNYPGVGQMVRIAERLGMLEVVKP